MAQVWKHDELEAAQESLVGRSVSILGYGNQGRAQALNLRDQGFQVFIGNQDDAYREQAIEDGFTVSSIAEASQQGDYVALLLPDEVQPEWSGIFAELKPGQILGVASGYNLAFGHLKPSSGVDVVMVAPRMIGRGVRTEVQEGRGFPVLVGVWQDASGHARDYALAYAGGIGARLSGGSAVWSSCEEEATLDLFSEHTWAGAVLFFLQACYETLTNAGISSEAAILELYGSGEIGEIGNAMAQRGLFGQLSLHSTTSQYGQLTRGPRFITPDVRSRLVQHLADIREGRFAKEWSERAGGGTWRDLAATEVNPALTAAEDALYQLLGRR